MTAVPELRGAVLGKGYRVAARLGAEADGTYEATHERVPGRFILRVFPVEGLYHPDAPIRIHRAAAVASLLRDPHVLQTLDFGAAGEASAFVVSELAEGRWLPELLAAGDRLSLDRTLALVEAVAAALREAHAHGLVHGDLRPAHILLPRSGQPVARLAGFGWAMELRAVLQTPLPSAALAPEQQGGTVVATDPRTDQFALGVLVYQALSGRLPFSDQGVAAAPALADLVPGVPGAVDDVLRRALAPSPAARFDDVADLAACLREAARRPAAPPGAPEREAPRVPALASTAAGTTGPAAPPQPSVPPAPRATAAPQRPSAALPGMTPVPAAAALPGAVADDVTEELDVRTLWPPLQKGDSGKTLESLIPKDDALDLELLFSPEDDMRGAPAGPWRRPDAGGGQADDETLVGVGYADLDLEVDLELEPPRAAFPSASRPGPAAGGSGRGGGEAERDALDELSLLPPPDPTRTGRRAGRGPHAAPGSSGGHGNASLPRGRTVTDLPATAPRDQRTSATTTGRSRRMSASRSSSSSWSRWWVAAAGGLVAIAAGGAAGAWFAQRQAARHLAPMAAQPAPGPPKRATATATATAMAMAPSPPPTPALPAARAVSAAMPGADTSAPLAAPGPAGTEDRAIAARPIAPMVATAPAGRGACALRIASRPPAAELWLDGKFTGHRTPVVGLRVPCGVHRLSLHHGETGAERSEIIKTSPGRPFTGDYPLE